MMSGLGTKDGAGASKTSTVSCSHCNIENEIKSTEVQYTSFSKLITCKSCDEEIILIDDLMDTGMTSVVTVETVADGGPTGPGTMGLGLKSTDGGPEEGADHRPVGLRQRGHQRKLKSSASVTEVGSGRHGPMDAIQQSASLGAIAQNGSELTTDTLKQLSAMIKEHPCTHCGCAERDLLRRVEGNEGVFYCHGCDRPYGIDDGMNFFDFQEFLGTGFRMEPCSSCGNDDPDKFTLDRANAGEIDSSTELVVRCNVCSTVSPSGLGGQVVVEEDLDVAVEVSGSTACSSCGNKDSQKFKVRLDECNNTIESVCMACNDKKLTKASGQVCSCEEASIDYGFNEYGYISQIKCNACGAATKMSEDARKKAASDGSSCGRTRIRSLDLVRRGDHIAWHQWLGYWHHAIVVEVQFNWINLIHYNGPSAYKGEIVDEWRELDATKEEVYRINYDRKVRTYDPNIIVERARSRLKEHSYNLLSNNCEHFARWCVTGQHRSIQVQTFYEYLMNRVNVAVKGRAAQSMLKNGVNLAKKGNLKFAAAVGDRGVSALMGSGDKVAAKVGATVATGEVKSVASGFFAKGLTAGFSVGYEIYSVVADIQQAHRQRADGAIDRNEFLKITIKRSCEGVGSLVGTAVTLTIPVACNSVGLTLGTIIGKGIGAFVGRNVACRLVGKGVAKS